MADTPYVRVGTADREQAVDLLTRHLGEGRLTLAEFGDRCAAAEAARTYRDLAVLFSDLPQLTPPPTRGRAWWLLLPVALIGAYAGFAATDLVAWFVPVALVLCVASGLLYVLARRRRSRPPHFLQVATPDLPAAVPSRTPSRFGFVPYALVLFVPALMLRQPIVVLAAVGFLIFSVVRGIE